ncbi:CHAT domain-containing protein [Lactarius akahatsu]|uniref:CHAT domain-containing protein n=1 Tax=Lactarius akahatsu TaxID=416441 RepID=A0AAD4LJ73_9AGAM|nr:CHAT domain-containing protein [Lactarius akahatsu]
MHPQVSIDDIEITFLQGTRSQFPRSHCIHIVGVQSLAIGRFMRYGWFEEKEDLDKCILHFTEAILLPPVPTAAPGLSIVELLFRLALVLLHRSKKFEQLDDVRCAVEYLRCLRALPLDSSDLLRNKVTESLVEALYFHVRLGTQDPRRNMEEMLVLCRELLASDISTHFPTAAFTSLCLAIETEPHGPLLDEVIGCLREAVKACPPHSHLHQVRLTLADALRHRFAMTHSRDDYEDARALFEKVVDPNHSGENLGSEQLLALLGLYRLAYNRANYFKNPEYFEEAMSHCRFMLGNASLPKDIRSFLTEELLRIVSSQGTAVFEDLSYFDGIRETYSKAAIEDNILKLKDLLSNTRLGTPGNSKYLDSLAGWYRTKFSLTNDTIDIEESIKYWRLLLDATDVLSNSRSGYLIRLCTTLNVAFRGTNEIRYLDESIIVCYDILKLEGTERTHFDIIRMLLSSLFARLSLFNRTEDVNEVMRLIPLATDDRYAQAPARFELSCTWAYIARRIGHPSISVAYAKAMTLMQDSLSFSPTVQIQHDRLVAMDDMCKRMPFDYASYQVGLGRLEAAIETLEQGRALLWSEMRGLRTPTTGPNEEDLPLARRLAGINQELETVAMSIAPSRRLETENSVTQGSDGFIDAFGRLFLRQRKLQEERDELISQLQGRPGFEGFSKTPSFATLQLAASHGPVIIINHCEWRCDILILPSNARPSLIPTAEDFFDRANKLNDCLLDARNNCGLDSPEYELALCFILSELYQLVGKPVIQRLRELGTPEQSRIWWCPTSVFCSLPLHAMGPIPPTNEVRAKPQYISDLYICSYTPTLSALIESRDRDSHPSGKSSLLLVAQPDISLPDAQAEIKVIQALSVQVTSLVSEDATSPAVVDGLRDHTLVHFTCHGTLERAKPFDASFELHGGDRLTLLEIVRSRLPSAEFAFLAACHTAELTEASVPDEGLHLVAAMQYCGFRSAVGTMWAMADIDGPDLARYFYKSMLSKKKEGIPYYERAAEALRDAVQRLRRKKRISLERWVNFVHYGA